MSRLYSFVKVPRECYFWILNGTFKSCSARPSLKDKVFVIGLVLHRTTPSVVSPADQINEYSVTYVGEG